MLHVAMDALYELRKYGIRCRRVSVVEGRRHKVSRFRPDEKDCKAKRKGSHDY